MSPGCCDRPERQPGHGRSRRRSGCSSRGWRRVRRRFAGSAAGPGRRWPMRPSGLCRSAGTHPQCPAAAVPRGRGRVAGNALNCPESGPRAGMADAGSCLRTTAADHLPGRKSAGVILRLPERRVPRAASRAGNALSSPRCPRGAGASRPGHSCACSRSRPGNTTAIRRTIPRTGSPGQLPAGGAGPDPHGHQAGGSERPSRRLGVTGGPACPEG